MSTGLLPPPVTAGLFVWLRRPISPGSSLAMTGHRPQRHKQQPVLADLQSSFCTFTAKPCPEVWEYADACLPVIETAMDMIHRLGHAQGRFFRRCTLSDRVAFCQHPQWQLGATHLASFRPLQRRRACLVLRGKAPLIGIGLQILVELFAAASWPTDGLRVRTVAVITRVQELC